MPRPLVRPNVSGPNPFAFMPSTNAPISPILGGTNAAVYPLNGWPLGPFNYNYSGSWGWNAWPIWPSAPQITPPPPPPPLPVDVETRARYCSDVFWPFCWTWPDDPYCTTQGSFCGRFIT